MGCAPLERQRPAYHDSSVRNLDRPRHERWKHVNAVPEAPALRRLHIDVLISADMPGVRRIGRDTQLPRIYKVRLADRALERRLDHQVDGDMVRDWFFGRRILELLAAVLAAARRLRQL